VREEPGGFCIGGEFPEGKVLAISSAGTAGRLISWRPYPPRGATKPRGTPTPPPSHSQRRATKNISMPIAITLDTYSHVLTTMQDSAARALEDALR
jgi:hypothetical protein